MRSQGRALEERQRVMPVGGDVDRVAYPHHHRGIIVDHEDARHSV
jgi:hypothetical protein